MKDLNYNKMGYKELIDTIISCQKELENRGTTTFCFNVFSKGEETIYIKEDNMTIKYIRGLIK
jgi:hypothetical protein